MAIRNFKVGAIYIVDNLIFLYNCSVRLGPQLKGISEWDYSLTNRPRKGIVASDSIGQNNKVPENLGSPRA